ncbi:MAG: hypothetical protein M1816_006068 [Peltula sp. TS41687]|nr:MAG: hypothetical protein M1816_006068 [Peltula sp. TS41687]
MTDYQRSVLSHYKLSNPFPGEWPAEKDQTDEPSLDVPLGAGNTKLAAQYRRFSVLDYLGSDGQTLPRLGQETPQRDNAGRTDEPDPLGASESLVRLLRQRGLPVNSYAQLRNRYLLTSTTYSPALYLSQVHSNVSTQRLLQGLDYLSRSMDQISSSLKALVESNFERFVKVKATLDNVYNEMRMKEEQAESEKRQPHSRHTSRASNHFRNANGSGSGPNTGSASNTAPTNNKQKNALIKESEYGVQGIKAPILDVSAKAQDLWGPAMGGLERGESMKAISSILERYRMLFESSRVIADFIKRRDYNSLVEEYGRVKRSVDDSKNMAKTVMNSGDRLTDAQIYQITINAQIWLDIDQQVEELKRDVWRRLVGKQPRSNTKSLSVSESKPEEYMELISVLLELGVEDNPIWMWLLSRYDYLKNRITAMSERFKLEVEYFRRRLAAGDKPSPSLMASQFRLALRQESEFRPSNLDSVDVLHLWEGIYASLKILVASQGGILGEVIEFWEVAQSFILGKTQRTLPVGLDGQSRRHHRLSADGVKDLQHGVLEMINLIRDSVLSFFLDPPPTDISALFPQTTTGPPTTPKSAVLTQSAFRDPRFDVDANNVPPPSPKVGDFWEKFTFWPPYSNSLSGVHYLGRILELISTAAGEMVTIAPMDQTNTSLERLRSLVGGVRDRCVQAICAAWNHDAENCKILEDWTRASGGKNDVTNMPSYFMTFESNVLSGMQKNLYVSGAMSKSGTDEVVLPPPAKLLQLVRSQFVTSLYKALSGMVENAEKPLRSFDDEWGGSGSEEFLSSLISSDMAGTSTVNPHDRNIRMLLTLSNLQVLRTTVVPQLISQFENFFSVKLTEESKTIRDVLGQIDARLFHSYTRPTVINLSRVIRAGILAPSWAPSGGRPSEVRPYVYEALLSLVLVHTQVSTTTASLTPQILSYLLEQTSKELLEAFRQRPKFSLAALMQATLDVEFVAQTLREYTTDKASEIQSQIYLELDRRTDNDARMKLQSELPEMRNILKTLKENSRAEL